MKLHHSFGMNPRLVRMFIAEKGIDIEKVDVDILAGDNRKEPYTSRNPSGQMPLLELEDGTFLAESAAICEYLEDLHPEHPLIGTTPLERAEARQWLRRVEIQICHPAVFAFYYAEGYDLFKSRVHCIPEAADGLKERVQVALRWLDGLMKPGSFIAGDRFTVADIALFTYLDQLSTVGQTIPEDCKNLQDWFAAVNSRPSAEASLWPEQPMGMRG